MAEASRARHQWPSHKKGPALREAAAGPEEDGRGTGRLFDTYCPAPTRNPLVTAYLGGGSAPCLFVRAKELLKSATERPDLSRRTRLPRCRTVNEFPATSCRSRPGWLASRVERAPLACGPVRRLGGGHHDI